MHGTAGLSEDARQPPYLCLVDLAKVLHASSSDDMLRCRALLAFCERFEECDRMFAAFAAWLRVRTNEIESRREVIVID
jgi:archaemetzincin